MVSKIKSVKLRWFVDFDWAKRNNRFSHSFFYWDTESYSGDIVHTDKHYSRTGVVKEYYVMILFLGLCLKIEK